MPPRPHGHGDDEEEEEVIITPRTDGPPFVDIHAKQGRGFDVDYDTVQKYLGPGKVRRGGSGAPSTRPPAPRMAAACGRRAAATNEVGPVAARNPRLPASPAPRPGCSCRCPTSCGTWTPLTRRTSPPRSRAASTCASAARGALNGAPDCVEPRPCPRLAFRSPSSASASASSLPAA